MRQAARAAGRRDEWLVKLTSAAVGDFFVDKANMHVRRTALRLEKRHRQPRDAVAVKHVLEEKVGDEPDEHVPEHAVNNSGSNPSNSDGQRQLPSEAGAAAASSASSIADTSHAAADDSEQGPAGGSASNAAPAAREATASRSTDHTASDGAGPASPPPPKQPPPPKPTALPRNSMGETGEDLTAAFVARLTHKNRPLTAISEGDEVSVASMRLQQIQEAVST